MSMLCTAVMAEWSKALDSKSNGVSPRRFESCSQRDPFFIYYSAIEHAIHVHALSAINVLVKHDNFQALCIIFL